MRHGAAGTGLGLAGIGIGLLVFLADRLEWGLSSLVIAGLIVVALALVVAGIEYVGFALLDTKQPAPLEVIYALDGHSDLQVRLWFGNPQIVLLQVGLKNPNPFNVESVAINSLIPQGLQQGRCGAHGEPLEGGRWLTTPEKLPDEPPPGATKDYWADENVSIAGNGSKLLLSKPKVAGSTPVGRIQDSA